jgi:hypothetical protein
MLQRGGFSGGKDDLRLFQTLMLTNLEDRKMRTIKIAGSLAAAFMLLGILWAVPTQSISRTQGKNRNLESGWNEVNRSARDVRPGDRRAVQQLVDKVFVDNGLDTHISATAASIKDRLIDAELDFHNGNHDGIDVEKVAVAVNQLTDRLNLPAFARTDAAEVKKVRVRMLTLYPGLIGRGSAARRDDTTPHFEEKMSPVEAFHVAATLLQQKVFNPEFQQTKEEQQQMARQTKTLSQARANRKALLPGAGNGERTRQMILAIREGARTMSFRDMLDQSEQSLDLLGIRR